MPRCQVVDNAISTLAAAYTAGTSTQLTVVTGDGVRFGTPTVANPLRISVMRASAISGGMLTDLTKYAIYKATSRTGDVLSGLTLESGTDQNFGIGDVIGGLVVAATITELSDDLETVETGLADTVADVAACLVAASNLADLQSAATARTNLGFATIAAGTLWGGAGSTLPAAVAVGSGLLLSGGVLSASGGGAVSSVGLTMPSGFSVAGSPVTTSGTLAVSTALNGVIKGDGSGFLAAVAGTDFILPTGVGGGQTVQGGTAANESLLLRGTSHATPGAIKIGATNDYTQTTNNAVFGYAIIGDAGKWAPVAGSPIFRGLQVYGHCAPAGATGQFAAFFVSPYFESTSGNTSSLISDIGTRDAAYPSGTHTTRFSIDNTGKVMVTNTLRFVPNGTIDIGDTSGAGATPNHIFASGTIRGNIINALTSVQLGGSTAFDIASSLLRLNFGAVGFDGVQVYWGSFVMGTAALATTATSGFIYTPSCAGTPTGTPATFTGRTPLIVDTTGSKLWVYLGGAWKSTTLA
jgi:hypothetical protein